MIQIYSYPNEVLESCADYIVMMAAEAIVSRGRFNLALSGGSSPKGLYELLASPAYRSRIDWSRVYFFFGDERYVPADHPDSNALMAKKALFEPLAIPPDQIFAVDTSLDVKAAAHEYQKTIEEHFALASPAFDLVLLGLGDNSHTASLFPFTDVLDISEPGVKEVFLKEQNVYRITFTAPLINMAHHIVFLVFGSGKAEAVHHVLRGEKDFDLYPAQLIKPESGDVIWFMDTAASAKLEV